MSFDIRRGLSRWRKKIAPKKLYFVRIVSGPCVFAAMVFDRRPEPGELRRFDAYGAHFFGGGLSVAVSECSDHTQESQSLTKWLETNWPRGEA